MIIRTIKPQVEPSARVVGDELRIVMPPPPSVNKLYRPSEKFGGRVKTDAYNAYKKLLGMICCTLVPADWMDQLFAVDFTLVNSRLDIDNAAKVILDTMSGLVWHDDSQVNWIKLARGPKDDGLPRVEIIVFRADRDPWERKQLTKGI